MTEHDWLTCRTTPMAMCHHVEKLVSVRKLRLLSTQACRLLWDGFSEPAKQAIEAMERWAEQPADDRAYSDYFDSSQQLRHDETRAFSEAHWLTALCAVSGSVDSLTSCVRWLQEAALSTTANGTRTHALDDTRAQLCDLFREIVGNPFRPWKAVPSFLDGGVMQPDGQIVRLSGTAVDLAEAIHALQAFDRLPILADALEECGVTDIDLLAHCRDTTATHARGCWALDVVRGKT